MFASRCFLLLLLLAASCCAHIFSVNWVRCLLEKNNTTKIINSLVSSQYHRHKFVPRLFNVLCQTAENVSRTRRMLTASTRCDRCFACRKHFSLIKMLTKKKPEQWQGKTVSIDATAFRMASTQQKFLLEIIMALNRQFKTNWRNYQWNIYSRFCINELGEKEEKELKIDWDNCCEFIAWRLSARCSVATLDCLLFTSSFQRTTKNHL